jgi:uncharacterized protein YdeI (YjbR/CyaY-like superfamily)
MKKSIAVSPVPKDLGAALASNPNAGRVFRAMPPSHQREYIRVIEEAKKPETRARRLAKAVEKIAAKSGD